MRTPVHTLALTAAAALLAAGCSGGSEAAAPATSTPTVTATATPAASATPSPAASLTGTPSPAPSTLSPKDPLSPRPGLESAAPVGQPACRSSALTVTDADTLVGPRYLHEVFVLRTTGQPCQLAGYPRLTLLGSDGRALAVRVQQGGLDLPSERPTTVTLSRTTSLSFTVATARDGATCAVATHVLATLPGTSTAVRAATDLRVCGASGAMTVATTPVHRQGDQE